MTEFGQGHEIDLSDEALERQSSEAPQEEETEVVEEIAEETVAETPPEEDKEDKSYEEIRKGFTQKAMENAEIKRQKEAAERRIAELEAQLSKPQEEIPDKEILLQKFLDSPEQTIYEIAQKVADQKLTPISQQLEEARTKAETTELASKLQTAIPSLMREYAALNSAEATTELINKAVELSKDFGDDKAFRRNPERMLKLAALELHGYPRTDPKLIAEQARKETLAEMNKKEAAKNGGLSVSKTQQPNEKPLTEEDEIKQGIFGSSGRGLRFGS